jgi:hypothetical protein
MEEPHPSSTDLSRSPKPIHALLVPQKSLDIVASYSHNGIHEGRRREGIKKPTESVFADGS